MELARLWALGRLREDDDETASDEDRNLDDALASFGLRLVGPAPTPRRACFVVWPEALPAWDWFCRLLTQWRWSGGMEPRRMGLDYAAVIACLQAHGYRRTRRARRSLEPMLDDLRACEAGALQGWAEVAARAARGRG